METQLLTPEQVGQLLQIKPESVYELTRVRSQKRQPHPIPFVKVAGKVRFPREAINQWLLKLQGVEKAA
jgi:excisionase family DNA binding protein